MAEQPSLRSFLRLVARAAVVPAAVAALLWPGNKWRRG
jgi:hypothetical protein